MAVIAWILVLTILVLNPGKDHGNRISNSVVILKIDQKGTQIRFFLQIIP